MRVALLSVSLLVFLSVAPVRASKPEGEFVHHPVPKEPVYLKADWYGSLRKSLTPLPQKDSEAQRADEAELFRLQKARTPADCERAKAEVFATMENFFQKPRGPLDETEIKKISGFFAQIRNDGDYFIQKLKKDFPRKRPFAYIQGIEPCVPKEVTGAYPSGHAVLSELYALVLSDLYPSHEKSFRARAAAVAEARVFSGMHHPSDIRAGVELARLIYPELQKSKEFQAELKRLR